MMFRSISELSATAFFVISSALALIGSAPPAQPCKTLGRSLEGGGFEFTCPLDSACTAPSLCDYHSMQVGNEWRHWCACDMGGTETSVCNGWMDSLDEDPDGPGISFHCPEVNCPEAEGGGECVPAHVGATLVSPCECV
jgi:hypothetical protein